MSNKKITIEHWNERFCIYCLDGICLNDQSPVCADYCPTIVNPGVCRFEKTEEYHGRKKRIETCGHNEYPKIIFECGENDKMVMVKVILNEYQNNILVGYLRNLEYAHILADAVKSTFEQATIIEC